MADRTLSVAISQEQGIPLQLELSCAPGAVLAIFGPSGSGKTTILRTIAGLYTPASAVVRCGSDTWLDTSRGLVTPPHRRAVGFVFQEYALFPHLTALGNVMTAMLHRPRNERRARAESLLALVHLPAHADRRPHDLSGGERQRVAVARALARDPDVLLLDEPFAAVDRAVRRRLQDEIDTIRRNLAIPLVLVTHDFDDVIRLADEVLILERGRAVASGPVDVITSRPDVPFVRAAIGLGSVFDATVARRDPTRGLLELEFDGGRLLAPLRAADEGSRVRVRIPAREVILATGAPPGLSLHNTLTGVVTAVVAEPALDQVVVQLAIGSLRLLAEVTRDAVARLRIAPGQELYALIKSVSLEVQGEYPPAQNPTDTPTQAARGAPGLTNRGSS